MKISEAMKKATPGPMQSEKEAHGDCWLVTGKIPAPGSIAEGCEQIDAALLAHWYNVGPKLLKTLNCLSSINDREFDRIQPIIAEAGEVEGI